ncbi:MAG: Spy/CpxP family protein refolding chaperone [Rubrivivax sp.]|nr:Spy/CpxP family protein refolding chaperone [Rubrivivax sp.]
MNPHTPHPRTGTRALRQIAMLAALAAAGATGLAIAAPHGQPQGHAGRSAPGMMMPFGGPGMGRMLDDVQATPEQRAQIEKIAESARADLRGQHEASQALRAQSMQLFAQPTVDATAVETLRQQMLAQHDVASRRTMQAMLDVSQVLTAEQRQQIATRMAARMAEKGQRHGPEHGGRGERKGG